ncbi:MAG TPA: hypothetical protein VGE52_05635, partial [Pirellulales bacterium]
MGWFDWGSKKEEEEDVEDLLLEIRVREEALDRREKEFEQRIQEHEREIGRRLADLSRSGQD